MREKFLNKKTCCHLLTFPLKRLRNYSLPDVTLAQLVYLEYGHLTIQNPLSRLILYLRGLLHVILIYT